MNEKPRERWAVVGGGFLGMTLALRLAQQGKAVTLFESADSLGGLAGAWELGDVVWDRHYHVILNTDSYLRDLLRELGLEDEIQWSTTRIGFYVDSKFYSLSNTLEFLRFPPLSFVEKMRLGATIFYASRIKDWRALEKIPVEAWLERWSGRRVVKKIWLPLLRAKLGENYRETSAAFIWAKSLPRRTSLPEKVKRAPTSISGISCTGWFFWWPANIAWLTRFSAARGFCFSLLSGATGENIASIFSISSCDFQNSRKASSKVG